MKFRTTLTIFILSLSSLVALAGKTTGKPTKAGNGHKQQLERSIKADASVVLSVCVVSGAIEVRGWDKNEVRVRANDAAELEFRRQDGTPETKPATKVELLIADKAQGPGRASSCRSFSDVEIDAPQNAVLQLQTRDGDISVTGVGSVYVNTQNGDVLIERASKAVNAGTIGGNITLKNSSGRINLHSIGGSIEATNIKANDTSEGFDAGSVGGDITLERVANTQLNAHTLNGGVSMTGPLARGGRYGFRTISGDVTLTMPSDASFQLAAKISQSADIITDFPLTLKPEESVPQSRRGPAPMRMPAPTPKPDKKDKKPKTDGPPEPAEAPEPVIATIETTTTTDTTATVETTPRVSKVKVIGPTGVTVQIPNLSLRRINAVHGSGDAIITLASFSGTIHLKKL